MIFGLDATNWIHTLWHAAPGPEVAQTFFKRLRAICEKLKPQHIVACFDRRSFRADRYPAYKAGRPQKDPGLCHVLAAAEVAVGEIATIVAQEGFEADDGLATLAACGPQIGQQVVLASPDKDLRQCLVAGSVIILRGFKLDFGKVVETDYFRAENLSEKYELTPEQWPSYQALCGDSGDGIPGCPGWGEKTTRAALAGGKTLADCLANPWTLPVTARQRTALTQFDAALMLELVTLRTDVDAVWDALR